MKWLCAIGLLQMKWLCVIGLAAAWAWCLHDEKINHSNDPGIKAKETFGYGLMILMVAAWM